MAVCTWASTCHTRLDSSLCNDDSIQSIPPQGAFSDYSRIGNDVDSFVVEVKAEVGHFLLSNQARLW